MISEKGRYRQLFVPRDWEPIVQGWVGDYRRAKELLEEISRLYWEKVRTRQG